jgi:hypothetical protein
MEPVVELRSVLWHLLGFGLLPLWLAAGGADWLSHRRTHIERTSGARESLLHLALFLEIAVPVLLALWLEITAALLVLMAAGVMAHMVTSWWDTSYAQPRRHIAPLEQQIHSWLEMLPLFALVIVALLHTAEFNDPRWSLIPRGTPAPPGWRWSVILGFALGMGFILEETWRGARARRVRGRRVSTEAPRQ